MKTINLKTLLTEGGVHEYGCVMAYAPQDISSKLLEFSKRIIPDEILYIVKGDDSYGRESKFHATIKYGLTEIYTEEQIRNLIKGTKPFIIEIGDISIFENEKFDVIKFTVNGKELRRLNAIFSKLPNEDKYPDYNPHMTLAYVKKGYGKKFVTTSDKIAHIMIDTISYSHNGAKKFIKL